MSPDDAPAVPSFDALSFEDKRLVDARAEAYSRALAADPDADLAPYLDGVTGDVYLVLVHELVLETFDRLQERHAQRVAADLLARLPAERALVEAVLRERLAVAAEPAGPSPDAPASAGPAGWPPIRGYDYRGEVSDRGASAVVFRAYARNPGRDVAVKVLRREYWAAAGGLAGYRREARLQVELAGAGVPAVYDVGFADDGTPYLAMELVTGDPVEARFPPAGRPFRFDPALVRLVGDVARTLAAAHRHEKRISHLDLSPHNVFVQPDGRVVLLDWGLGHDQAGADAGRAGGTPDFLAPEKARGEAARYGPASDVFSLGCFLVWALTGQRLFPDAPTAEEKVRRAAAGQLAEPVARLRRAPAAHQAPAELVELAVACLAVDPADRPADAGVVADRVEAYFQAEDARRQARGRWRTFWRTARWAAVLVVALAGVAWYAFSRAEADRAGRVAAEVEAKAGDGDVAAREGKWGRARAVWRPLLAVPGLDEARRFDLRLKLVRAAAFLGDRGYVREALDALDADPLASRFRGRLDFERAVELFSQSMDHATSSAANLRADANPYEAQALILLRRVRDDPAVSEADRLTARGLAAASADEAIAAYQEALYLQPFHPYAGPYCLLAYFLAGRMPEALARASAWAEASPEDPLPWFYQALLLTFLHRDDDAKVAGARLGRVSGEGRVFSPATLEACRGTIDVVRAVRDRLPEVMTAKDRWTAFAAQLAFLRDLGAAARPGGESPRAALFAIPLPPHQRRALGRFASAAWPGTDPAPADLDGVEAFVADGAAEFVRGLLHVQAGRHDEAARALRRSADSPRQLWDVRVVCWLCLATHALTLARETTDPARAAALRDEARGHLLRAAREPGRSPRVRARIRDDAAGLGDPTFTREVERLLAPHTP